MLTQVEKGQFLALFNRGGYVLNFSTNDFDVFTMSSIGVPLCTQYGMSKGKSLSAYVSSASDKDVLKLLSDLFDYYEAHYETEYTPDNYAFDPQYGKYYQACKEILAKNSTENMMIAVNADQLKEQFSSEYLSKQIDLMVKMQSENPTEAIGKAKELIESCCKTILEERHIPYDKDWDLNKLTGQTMLQLNLMPENIPSDATAASTMKGLLGNLQQVAQRMAELRNPYGSGHGKSASYKGLSERHAKLAVGASITFVTFLWDTHKERG